MHSFENEDTAFFTLLPAVNPADYQHLCLPCKSEAM